MLHGSFAWTEISDNLASSPLHFLSFFVDGLPHICTMSQIPTPSTSQPGSEALVDELKPAEASSELLRSLDTLLEQYLYLLDRQQELQSGLSKQLSSV